MSRRCWLAVAALVAAACGAPPDPVALPPDAVETDPFTGPGRCTSGAWRDPNQSEGPEMMPGRACNDCHASSNAASGGDGDAPLFAFAGTIYPSGHEPDDCIAATVASAVVTVTGADGITVQAVANQVGNFSFDGAAVALPLRATVTFAGRTRAMMTAPPSGDCNSCHTAAGRTAAPGRIVLP